jgi:oligopeptidase B
MKKRFYFLWISSFLLLNIYGCETQKMQEQQQEKYAIKPPKAAKIPYITNIHGISIIDNFFWLRDRNNPDVIKYLEDENGYADSIMADTKAMQEKIFSEMKGRINEDDESVPVKRDDYYYYYKTEEGKQYMIYCRKKGSLSATEEVLLDCNYLAEDMPYFSLGAYEISPDHQTLAYAIDTDGSESYTLYFKNLATGHLLEDEIPEISPSLEWANDNQTVFYAVHDEAKRPYKLFRHKVGSSFQEDMQHYHEEDERFFLSIRKTKNNEFLLINLHSKTSSEIHYLNANQPDGQFKIFSPRRKNVKYSVFAHNQVFYVLTNADKAVNYKIMITPKNATSHKNWQEFIPHSEDKKIEDIDAFSSQLAIYERENGLRKIRVVGLQNKSEYYIDFPEPAYTLINNANPDFNSKLLVFTYSSLVRPSTVYEYNLENKARQILKVDKIIGDYDPENYTSERIYAIAPDGARIPISLVYKKGLKKDGQNPLYLYGYGAYGITTDPYFNSNRLSLLDRGFIFALAHIRGGSDIDQKWYEEGKLLKKKNTFNDFIACAEHLEKENYTSPEKMVAIGGSAGGLLMGAVMNTRPELFNVIIAKVPFVDVINTMLDPTLPLTVTEYEEWGNPQEKNYFDYIYSYSPYDNVKAHNYPNILVTAGLNDPRVSYWEPAKWVAKIRDMKKDSNKLIFKTNMDAGHGGASGRYDNLNEIAYEYAFILKMLRITDNTN